MSGCHRKGDVMMPRVLVPLANSCEELEAYIIDLLRRAQIEVVTASLTDAPCTAPVAQYCWLTACWTRC